jgi:hypothetical protein
MELIVITKTNRKKQYLIELRECLGLKMIAAGKCGISRQCVYNWEQTDPVFKSAIEDIKEEMTEKVTGYLYQLIKEKNPTAILFYLKCKAGWTERTENIISGGSVPQNILFRFEHQTTTEEKPVDSGVRTPLPTIPTNKKETVEIGFEEPSDRFDNIVTGFTKDDPLPPLEKNNKAVLEEDDDNETED